MNNMRYRLMMRVSLPHFDYTDLFARSLVSKKKTFSFVNLEINREDDVHCAPILTFL